MKAIVNSQILAQDLRLLNRIVSTKPTLPILTHILLRGEPMGDKLYMSATDLDVGLSTVCEARIDEPGVIALSAKTLLALVEQFPDADVEIALDKTHAHIHSGSFKSRLQVLPSHDFPATPEMPTETVTLPTAALQTLIGRTRFAITDKATKHVLDGALLTLKGESAAMVAVDGKRLSVAVSPYTGPERQAIIPSKTLDLLSALNPESETVDFGYGSNHLFFRFGSRLLTSRVIDGQFPNYSRIIPRDNDKEVRIGRITFISVLRRVMSVAGDSQIVYLTFQPGILQLASRSAEIGEADEQANISYDGEPVKVCINGRYILDFLEAAVGLQITINLKDGIAPMLLSDGESFINVIMLMSTTT